MRKCRTCGTRYEPTRPLQVCCSIACALIQAKAARAKKEAKEDRAKKLKLKSRATWMREAQMAWNSYVRARDYGKPCASCGAMPEEKFGGSMDCSHYRSIGAAPHLRFHLHNAASACVKCNRYLSGNISALRIGLIQRNGLAKVEAIEANNDVRKFDIEYLKRIKKVFTKKTKRLLARRCDGL